MTNQVPVRPANRDCVYSDIDGERDYQDAGQGNAKPDATNKHAPLLLPTGGQALTLGEGLLCIEKIMADARAAWYVPSTGKTNNAMPFVRKAAAVAVQLMENYGSVPREGHAPLESMPAASSGGVTGTMNAVATGDKLAPPKAT